MKTQTNFADTLYETPEKWGIGARYLAAERVYGPLRDHCKKYYFVRLISDEVALYSGKCGGYSFINVSLDEDGNYELLDYTYSGENIVGDWVEC